MRYGTYDALVIPTGETTFGDKSFPVGRKAIDLFKGGRYGNIFVTGGHGGFAKVFPKYAISEAEETVDFLYNQGMDPEKVFYDNQSLETVGNFTFPLVQPMDGNQSLDEFKKIQIIAKEGHIWRIHDYVKAVMPSSVEVDYYSIPGKHNDGLFAKVYHKAMMKALKNRKDPLAAHEFLLKEHPFYSEDWYFKSPNKRKLITALKGLDWLTE